MALSDINAPTLFFLTSILGLLVYSFLTGPRNRPSPQQPKSEAPDSAAAASLASITENLQSLTTAINALRTTVENNNAAQTHATAALSLLTQNLESRVSTTSGTYDTLGVGENNHGSLSANSTTNTTSHTDDADLYRRKVEAMEGLRRVLEANPGGMVVGEDEALYRRRVEALEGLMRVLDAQPSVGARGRSRGGGQGSGEEETLADSLGL